MIDDEAVELLSNTLSENGIDQDRVDAAWLIKDGFVVGRRYACGPIKAVWFFDENEVKVCDQDGKLLKASTLATATKKAA